MRMSVAPLRDPEAERRAKEKAEAPTVKTEEQTKREEEAKAKEREKEQQREKQKQRANKDATTAVPTPAGAVVSTTMTGKAKRPLFQNVWKRKFRPLPESKAVDLFADVIGDAFILS